MDLKNIKYGRKLISEDQTKGLDQAKLDYNYVLLKREYVDMLYRMRLTAEEIEYILGFEYIEARNY